MKVNSSDGTCELLAKSKCLDLFVLPSIRGSQRGPSGLDLSPQNQETMRILTNSLILALLFLSFSGCAFTRMETARQLSSGEVMVAGTLDLPGFLYIPRAGGYVMVGVGDVADVSVHAATTIFNLNAGLGGRAYLGDDFILSLQGDYYWFFVGEFSPSDALLVATPRLTTAARDNRFYYGGVQSTIMTGLDGPEFFGAAVGVLGGLDYWWQSTGLGIQTEIIFQPITVGPGGFDSVFFAFGGGSAGNPEASLATFQISGGIYYRRPPRQDRERQIERSPYIEIDAAEERPRQPAPREQPREREPEPEPEFDDQGVPLY